jgi:surface polysaccharide O-acyltransferase-like enzyme
VSLAEADPPAPVDARAHTSAPEADEVSFEPELGVADPGSSDPALSATDLLDPWLPPRAEPVVGRELAAPRPDVPPAAAPRVATGDEDPEPKRAPRVTRSAGPGHLKAVDVVRFVTVIGVIAVHTVELVLGDNDAVAGPFADLVHVNREIFVFLTPFVLTHVYLRREGWSVAAFWRKRYWLIAVPYVVWTFIYELADDVPLTPVGSFVQQFTHDLLSGDARYHLYFLLVTMQLYLVFPLLLWLVKKTRGHHLALFLGSLALQVAFTIAFHYRLLGGSADGSGAPAGWMDHPDQWLFSYQLYILAGALAAAHLDELTAWLRAHRRLVLGALVATVTIGLASYAWDLTVRQTQIAFASEVFQPAVVFESLAVIAALYLAGMWWVERFPGSHRFLMVNTEATFGIYLAHPLLIQAFAVVPFGAATVVWLWSLPSAASFALVLLVGVPAVYLLCNLGVQLVLRTPVALAFTGRQRIRRAPAASPRASTAPSVPHRSIPVPAPVAASPVTLPSTSARRKASA